MKEPEKPKPPVLAIDIGGTKIISAIISQDGQMLAKERFPTLADEGPQAVIDRIFASVDRLLNQSNMKPSQLHSISIAAAGAIDFEKGVVTESPNLPGWHNIALRDIMQEKYELNTFLVNDASAAALGELRFGAGKGVSNLVLLTLGTGIGGGIIIGGELYTGATGGAGEIGHMTVEANGPRCDCGNIGCLESLASGTAVAKEAIERIKSGGKSSLVEMVKGKVEDITAEKVGVAARSGDPLARDIIDRAAFYLGVGLVSLVNIFNPEMIVLGGGMAKMGDILLEPARKLVRERAFTMLAQAVRIVTAKLGNEAGIYGAAAFAFRQKLQEA